MFLVGYYNTAIINKLLSDKELRYISDMKHILLHIGYAGSGLPMFYNRVACKKYVIFRWKNMMEINYLGEAKRSWTIR